MRDPGSVQRRNRLAASRGPVVKRMVVGLVDQTKAERAQLTGRRRRSLEGKARPAANPAALGDPPDRKRPLKIAECHVPLVQQSSHRRKRPPKTTRWQPPLRAQRDVSHPLQGDRTRPSVPLRPGRRRGTTVPHPPQSQGRSQRQSPHRRSQNSTAHAEQDKHCGAAATAQIQGAGRSPPSREAQRAVSNTCVTPWMVSIPYPMSGSPSVITAIEKVRRCPSSRAI